MKITAKSTAKIACTLLLAATFASIALSAQQAQPWKSIPIPPLHSFSPVQPKRIDLKNGMIIFLQEDHELPFISGSFSIRGGSREEPAAKIGLVDLYAGTWRTSGTAAVNGDLMDDQLEARAAKIETGNDVDSTSLSWSSLKGDFDTVFPQAVDLLLHPAFSNEKLTLAKQQMETDISRRNDDSGGILSREANKIVYGSASPYARSAEFSTVDAVTVDDLKQWHDRSVVPSGIILTVVGDFDSGTMEKRLRTLFETMPAGSPIRPAKVDIGAQKTGVYFINKDDVNQSSISIVGIGIERNNPDLYAISVMNEIFGGGFGSRLFQAVRTRLGLAYSVGGGFGAGYDHPGAFRVSAGTKSESTVAATKAMLEEIEKLKTNPPTEEELRSAKEQVLNSFIFRYDTREKVVGEKALLAFYGYPSDYLEKYRAGVEKVTPADVTRVAQKYIDANKLAIVVVGNSAQFGTALSTLGTVNNLDITIPQPPAAK